MDYLYSNTSLFSLSSTQASRLWSKISSFRCVLKGSSMVRYPFCSLPCSLTKEVQLFSGLGVYSGIFVLYLQCQSNKSTSKTTTIVFYAVCLLYALSTVDFISDLVALMLEVSNNSICSKNIIFYQLLCSRVSVHRFHLKLSKT